MIQALFASALLTVGVVPQTAVPNRSCEVTAARTVILPSLASSTSTDRTVYKFQKGILRLLSTDRPEYEYGKVIELEPLRYTVGNKTITFDSKDFAMATVVHTDAVSVRILRLRCKQ